MHPRSRKGSFPWNKNGFFGGLGWVNEMVCSPLGEKEVGGVFLVLWGFYWQFYECLWGGFWFSVGFVGGHTGFTAGVW